MQDQAKNTEASSFWTFFIKRRALCWVIVLAMAAGGTYSAITLPRDLQPEISIPFATITTTLLGANPQDVENLITKPLEKEIALIDKLKKLTSTSAPGVSIIVVEFEADADLDKGIDDVKNAVDRGKIDLPDDASEPQILKEETNDMPVISYSLSGDISLYQLSTLAEDIQDQLETVKDVSKVEIIGLQKKFIEIQLDPKKVQGYGLDIRSVADIIKFSRPNIPIGIVASDKLNYSIRIDNQYHSLEQLANTPIITLPDQNQTTLLLKDLGTVREALPEERVISKLSEKGQKSQKSITLQVFRKDGSNVIQVVDASKEKLEELKKTKIPSSIRVSITNDNSFFIRTDLGILTGNGYQTMILIAIVLFLAMGLVEGLIAGIIIPLSLLFAFIVMDLEGLTINSLTLFSLVIALGLIIDTAIVVMEAIHVNMKKGLSSLDAAIESVETFKWPLIAGTMTTVFAFLPMLLVSGIVGEFMKSMPLTITWILLGSLFLSLTVGPSLAAKFMKNRDVSKHKSILEPFFNWLGSKFHDLIYFILKRKITRIIVVLITFLAFLASLALPLTGVLQAELFPKTDVHFFIVNIETPKGTVLSETEKSVNQIEKIIQSNPEVENFLTIIGTGRSQTQLDLIEIGGSEESNLANITVNLIPKEQREKKSYEITRELREKFAKIVDFKVNIREFSEGPPTEAPITIRITGENLKTLEEISDHIENLLTKISGTHNVNSTLQQGLNEFKYTLDPDEISKHELNLSQVAVLIRNTVQGIKATNITINEEELDIYVRYNLPKKEGITNLSIKDIGDIQIPTPKGYSVSLSQLGEYQFGQSLSFIDREDQKRIVKVRSDLEAGISPVTVVDQVKKNLENYQTPEGYQISFGGDTQDIQENFNELYRSMILAVVLIGLVLILEFNSFKQAFLILLTLPMALIGVFPGLWLIGLKLSFPAFLGIVALAGVVVNEAIVMIDRINENRKNPNYEFAEAIAESSKSRMQSIIMTSITDIIGTLPLAVSNEFWAGLGFSLIFGVIFATSLTLIVIPVLYYMFEEKAYRKSQF